MLAMVVLLWTLTAASALTQAQPDTTSGASDPAATLVMVEQRGCVYCIRWMEEVGGEYPNTPEGLAAPLHRVNIRDGAPVGMSFARRAVFTPTFILMVDGQEVARLEGYPSEDFFWGLLGRMLDEAGVMVSPAIN